MPPWGSQSADHTAIGGPKSISLSQHPNLVTLSWTYRPIIPSESLGNPHLTPCHEKQIPIIRSK